MSLERAASFAVLVTAEPALRARLIAAIAQKTPTQAAMAVVRLAHMEGYDFTVDEAIEVQSRVIGDPDWEGLQQPGWQERLISFFQGW